jgi:nitrite reductase/ring-hydroxylating ferredoxin subunit
MADMQPPTEWRRVAAASELPAHSRLVVEHNGCRVLLLNVAGHLSAFEAVCPHQQYPLDDGEIADGRITCPFHGYSYWLETGENDYPSCFYPKHLPYLKTQVKPLTRFLIRVEGDAIWIAREAA